MGYATSDVYNGSEAGLCLYRAVCAGGLPSQIVGSVVLSTSDWTSIPACPVLDAGRHAYLRGIVLHHVCDSVSV